jgi:hypothetical protein
MTPTHRLRSLAAHRIASAVDPLDAPDWPWMSEADTEEIPRRLLGVHMAAPGRSGVPRQHPAPQDAAQGYPRSAA